MINANQIVWSEGLFLRPHHFQQQTRFIEQQFLQHARFQGQYQWGVYKLEIDAMMLKKGQLILTACEGILPDGTPFIFPGSDGEILSCTLSGAQNDVMVSIALPRRRMLGRVIGEDKNSACRFRKTSIEIDDITIEESDVVSVDVAVPNFVLKTGVVDTEEWISLPMIKVTEVREEGEIIIDPTYIAPCLWIGANTVLQNYVKEIGVLLNQRRKKLLQRISGIDEYGVAGITELLLLQVINRYEPLLEHYRKQQQLHPEQLYQYFLTLAAELSTFTRTTRSYEAAPAYIHQQLQKTFETLMADLREAFNYVFDEPAMRLPLKAYKYGLHIVSLQDHKVLHYKRFVLAVKAQMQTEELRQLFPTHVKAGPTERIKDLVNLQLPGIALTSLSVAPRQIPYHSEFVYFELNTHSELWSALTQSAGLAFHMGRNFPGIQLELWAIKG
jgi:type VI secretion system protein ImpJ